MRVLSANTARPRQVIHQGRPVTTGIFKTPSETGLTLLQCGVADDSVCDLRNHGGEHKAVYGFSFQHYAHWRRALDKPALQPGAFGENLTMSELDEAAICVGDRLRVGSALLEVSQPRVPCFKLGIALDDARAPALFTRHFYTGVYFRVLEEGQVHAGDEARFISRHDTAISIHALFRAYFDKDFEDALSLLSAAADIPELAPEWQEKVSAALARQG